jgi:inosine-uridine nucleoside N-ribohydrolase
MSYRCSRALQRISGVFVVALLLLAACVPQVTPAPVPSPASTLSPTEMIVVIDTDLAVDDWMAILYLLQRPEVAVEAITVTGTGEAHCDPGVRNALDLAALAGNADIPVSCGREDPLLGDHAFPAGWRDMVDGLAGLSLPANPNPPSSQTAVELLTSVIHDAPRRVVLVTLGPLTNVAEALQSDPSLVDRLKTIYIMGGAVHVPGNLQVSDVDIDNDVAEWNIYIDPHAAALVIDSGAPVTLVSLDATNHAPLTTSFYRHLEAHHTTPEADFVYRVLTQMQDFINCGGYYFWDPLAAAIGVDESLAACQPQALKVIEDEGPESGRTLAAADGSVARVCSEANGAAFEEVFLNTLNDRVP